MSHSLFDLFGFGFPREKEAKPVLTVDLMSDIPAQQLIRALKDCGLTIVERDGRLLICKAPQQVMVVWGDEKKPTRRKRKREGN